MASPPSTIADEFLDAGSSIGSYMASLLQVSAFRKGDGSKWHVYPDSSIVRKTACHGTVLGFVMGHDLRRLFISGALT